MQDPALCEHQWQPALLCIRDVVAVDIAARKFGAVLATVPEDHGVDQMRFNDGKGSPGGALILGRMHASWRKGHPGRLYR